MGFPGDSVVKNLPANVGDVGLIPGSERSSGEGSGNLLQYSCLGNPTDRGAWRAPVHGVPKEPDRTETKQQRCAWCLQSPGSARLSGWDGAVLLSQGQGLVLMR